MATCKTHNVEMERAVSKKTGKPYFSHRWEGEMCFGKGTESEQGPPPPSKPQGSESKPSADGHDDRMDRRTALMQAVEWCKEHGDATVEAVLGVADQMAAWFAGQQAPTTPAAPDGPPAPSQARAEAVPVTAVGNIKTVGDLLTWAFKTHALARGKVLEILGVKAADQIGNLDKAAATIAVYVANRQQP